MANYDTFKRGAVASTLISSVVSSIPSEFYKIDLATNIALNIAIGFGVSHVVLNFPIRYSTRIEPGSPKAIRRSMALAETIRPRSRDEIAYRVLSRYGKQAMLT